MRSVQAADASTFVSGFALPMNLDPHQVYDVPMQSMMLQRLRQSLPLPERSAARSCRGWPKATPSPTTACCWEFKLRPKRQVPRRQPADGGRRRLQLPSRAGAGRSHRPARSCKILKPENVTAPDPLTGAVQARDIVCAVLRGHPEHFHRQPAPDRAQRQERRLGQEPGWPRTARAPAPIASSPPATGRSNISTWRSTRAISSAGRTIPSR